MRFELVKIRETPAFCKRAARWFSEKWDVPEAAYRESMEACVKAYAEGMPGVPQWYVLADDLGEIFAGAGIIENDFHDRKELAPNLCALFVDEAYRGRGAARFLLREIYTDMRQMGIAKFYLITEHTEFYEKCGFHFLTYANSADGERMRLYETD